MLCCFRSQAKITSFNSNVDLSRYLVTHRHFYSAHRHDAEEHLSEAGFGRKNDFKISMSKQVIKENFHYCVMQLRLAKWI